MSHLQALVLTAICGLCPSLVVGAEVAPSAAHQPGAGGVLLNFGPEFAPTQLRANSTTADLVTTGDGTAIRVVAQAHGSWPGVTLTAPGGHWDLSGYSYVSVDLHNVDDSDLDIYVRVDNPGANGSANCMTERIGTQPDQRVTMTIPLKRVSNSSIELSGMHGYPQGLYAKGGIDPANIVAFTIFTDNNPSVERRFEVSQVRVFGPYQEPSWLAMTPEQFFPFIDTFGQFVHSDWPGKTHSLAELKVAHEAEATDLADHPAPSTWDAWGGWENGPQLEATGHFRTAKHEGKWWLVDPDGHLFFSVGFNCVGFGGATTSIENRETWFADLPAAEGDPLSAFRSEKSPPKFDFGSANLFRIYGEQWREPASERVHQRLRSWGMNTIGNWSDWRLCGMKRTPYVRTFFYQVPSLGGGKVKFPDVFAENFSEALDRGAKQFLGDSGQDPWCIGYFVDNEMAWGGDEGLAGYALTSPATQAAKQAFATWLKERHATIADLNTAWETKWPDWDAFLADTKTMPHSAIAKQDLNDFTGVMAEMYFREIKGAIQRIAPHKLYLGCRSVGGSRNVIAAAAKYCDVISYNRYCASVRNVMLPEGIDAPLMIGEFHFGAVDRGPFSGGLFSADNQEDRAAKFTTYVQSALDNPQMVGVHWFQYGDQAATGRGDGENYQCGFVDVCDRPYVETIAASRACAENMYQRRSAAPVESDTAE